MVLAVTQNRLKYKPPFIFKWLISKEKSKDKSKLLNRTGSRSFVCRLYFVQTAQMIPLVQGFPLGEPRQSLTNQIKISVLIVALIFFFGSSGTTKSLHINREDFSCSHPKRSMFHTPPKESKLKFIGACSKLSRVRVVFEPVPSAGFSPFFL